MSRSDEVVRRLREDIRKSLRIASQGHRNVASKVIRSLTPENLRMLAAAIEKSAIMTREMADELEGKELALLVLKGQINAPDGELRA
jgi:hypothetical protein